MPLYGRMRPKQSTTGVSTTASSAGRGCSPGTSSRCEKAPCGITWTFSGSMPSTSTRRARPCSECTTTASTRLVETALRGELAAPRLCGAARRARSARPGAGVAAGARRAAGRSATGNARRPRSWPRCGTRTCPAHAERAWPRSAAREPAALPACDGRSARPARSPGRPAPGRSRSGSSAGAPRRQPGRARLQNAWSYGGVKAEGSTTSTRTTRA